MTHVAVVQSIYSAFGKGDLPGLLATLAPDVVFVCPGPACIPYAGTFRGPAAVGGFFAALAGAGDILAFEVTEFVEAGDRVFVTGRETIRAKPTDRTFVNEWIHCYTLKGGRVVAFREYADIEAIAAAFR